MQCVARGKGKAVGLKKIRNPERMVRIAVGYTGHTPPKSDDTDANTGGLLEEKFISRMIKLACTPISPSLPPALPLSVVPPSFFLHTRSSHAMLPPFLLPALALPPAIPLPTPPPPPPTI
ncbi:unnamed protein product [Pleuronectes platessa]|uniref:Uncharacterized protein n=1 Tax=Pleuronectes platessa TaxID=8262 RepID=A0A9N7VS22_PLEPL|nr:unnamed protein product [Pleuronectes platessa]